MAPDAPSAPLDFGEYQRRASETSHLPLEGPQSAVAPMLGLASETGAILDSHKRYLRDRIDMRANREFLREELGDLLWYTAAVATASGLDLDDIARNNLVRTHDLYTDASEPVVDRLRRLPQLDRAFPEDERFPRLLVLRFSEAPAPNGQLVATAQLAAAYPNAFPNGAIERDGRKVGFTVGEPIGDALTDNSRRVDAYRFHDAIHLAFMAVLGWSPTMRSLLRLKRKSDTQTDRAEDGARAVFAEEGISAVLSRFAERRLGFLSEASVDGFVLDVIRAVTCDLEVEPLPAWVWRRAISQGFFTMKMLSDNSGGFVTADLDARELWYSSVMPDVVSVGTGERRATHAAFTAPALRDAIVRLHSAKTQMYGDAWKRRGEVLGVIANLARKVDRLGVGLGSRGARTTDGETDLDTSVDLLVYCVKYQTFLADIDPACSAALFPPPTKLTSPFSDHSDAFEAILDRRGFPELATVQEPVAAVRAVLEAFAELERCFLGVRANGPPAARLECAERLTSAAMTAIGAIAQSEPGAYRRFLAAERTSR